jgi:uncharacterized membrane protein YeaQ/YmgE (transglycosylase-associated protein family)
LFNVYNFSEYSFITSICQTRGYFMGIMEVVIMLAIGAVAGWLAGTLMRGSGFGLVGDIVIGIVGAVIGTFIGGFVSGATGLIIPGIIGTLVWAVIGAMLLLFVIGLVKKV